MVTYRVSAMFKLGFSRMNEAIKNSEDLATVLGGMLKTSDVNPELASGGGTCLAMTWVGLRAEGYKGTTRDADLQPFINGSIDRIKYDLMQSSATDRALFVRQLAILCEAVSVSKAHFDYDMSMFDTTPTEPGLAVRLVGSPDRVTTQTIQRDSNMEIVSTTTREKDSR